MMILLAAEMGAAGDALGKREQAARIVPRPVLIISCHDIIISAAVGPVDGLRNAVLLRPFELHLSIL